METQQATPPVSRRRRQTRANLLQAAFTVFATKGFGRVTIEEVCEAAGYSRGAFYSNFDSLDQLFFALYQARADQIADQFAQVFPDRADQFEVSTVVDQISEALLDRDWLLVKTDFLVHAARHPALAQALLEHRRQLRQAVADRLAAVSGRFPAWGGPDEADQLARAVVAVYDGVTNQLLLDRDTAAARAWLKELFTALLVPGGPARTGSAGPT